MINWRVRVRLSGHLSEGGGLWEAKYSSNNIGAIERDYPFSVWSPTGRSGGVSPKEHSGSERWPLRVREPLSRFSGVGLGAVLFVRAHVGPSLIARAPLHGLWEPTSFSNRGLEHHLTRPWGGFPERFRPTRCPLKASLDTEARVMTISKIGSPASGLPGFLPVDSRQSPCGCCARLGLAGPDTTLSCEIRVGIHGRSKCQSSRHSGARPVHLIKVLRKSDNLMVARSLHSFLSSTA